MKKRLLSLSLLFCLLSCAVPAAAADGADPKLPMQTNLTQIDWFPVWEAGYDGAGVAVALIDSGVNSRHEDLRGGNVLPTVDLTGTAAGDANGHGTFIAGMLSATRGNGVGIAGMVDGASLRPIKCFASAETDARTIADAIYAAVDEYGCAVVNLSAGIDEDVPALRAAVQHAADRGVIIVSAVGNDGTEALNWPAAYDSVVGVGSVDGAGTVSGFSQRNESVFVTAPGEGLVSTGATGNRSYVEGGGTSFSCAHVTALAAVAKQYDAAIDVWRFMELLRESAVDLGPAGYDTAYGWGLVNASAFLDALRAGEAPAGFTDISGHWAEAYVTESVARGLFQGVGDAEFAPDLTVSRAMAAELLYRLAGSPAVPGDAWRFPDVADGAWYAGAAAWAAQTGVFAGDENALFQPERALTRQEFAAVLARFAAWQGRDTAANAPPSYADAAEIAPWAREAAAWCAERGLITGRPGNLFDPLSGVTRAETAAILLRYMDTV